METRFPVPSAEKQPQSMMHPPGIKLLYLGSGLYLDSEVKTDITCLIYLV